MTAILALVLKWLAVIGAGALALFVARRDARKDAKREITLEAAERDAQTRKAIDNADLGLGVDDDERIKRLAAFAAKK